MSDAKSRYHIDEISECDDRNLFRLVDKLCHGSKVSKLPQHKNPKDLADKFADFFDNKIRTLRDKIDFAQFSPLSVDLHDVCPSTFTQFDILTPVEVLEFIKTS